LTVCILIVSLTFQQWRMWAAEAKNKRFKIEKSAEVWRVYFESFYRGEDESPDQPHDISKVPGLEPADTE
jgi:hypothetical protein